MTVLVPYNPFIAIPLTSPLESLIFGVPNSQSLRGNMIPTRHAETVVVVFQPKEKPDRTLGLGSINRKDKPRNLRRMKH